jgi:hypothetical protein
VGGAAFAPRPGAHRTREALAECGVKPWPVPRSQFMESARVPRIPRSTCARLGRALRRGLRSSWMEHFSNA